MLENVSSHFRGFHGKTLEEYEQDFTACSLSENGFQQLSPSCKEMILTMSLSVACHFYYH